MAVHAIDSFPDTAGQFTRLELEVPDAPADPLRLHFELSTDGTTFIDALSASLTTPFLIRVHKFDLAISRMFWGYYEFAATGRPVVTPVPAERKLVLQYTAAAARRIDARPTDGSVPASVPDIPEATLDPITVTITLHAAIRDLNHGWINFDFEHTWPSQIPARDAAFGWEQMIHYPFFDFAGSNPGAFDPVITGPMNFSAVYKASRPRTGVHTATGIAIHVEDVHGNQLEPFYSPDNFQLNYGLRNPMHLLGSDYVRAPKYTLSGGDIFGYGGNAIVYRVRAFQARGLVAGAPVGWYDAMEVYRSWLQRRFNAAGEPSLFYDKLRPERAKNAPVDSMAPHTVISNYGLDGAVDPGPAGSGQEQLASWLEMHPLRSAASDTPRAGSNLTFTQIANRLRSQFPRPGNVKLEVQGWGIEQASFYQFVCGFPPLTNVLSGDSTKFKAGVNALAGNQNTALSITSDPLNTCFNRGRFGGHIRFRSGAPWAEVNQEKHWNALIRPQFPADLRNRNCAVTVTKISGKQFNRIWIVEHFPPVEKVPSSPHTARFKAAQKKNRWGVLSQNPPRTASGLYRSSQKQICPTADVARIYLEDWVQPWILDQNVRLLEFMKHGQGQYFCYRADHTHVVAHPHLPLPVNPLYTNVIGYGAWYTRRLQNLLFDVHERGRVFDADAFCTFRLIHEFLPREALAPYIDQYYGGDEKFDFIYSHLVAPHETPGRGGWGIHPGYKEARKNPGSTLVKLDWMLSPDRDKADQPPKRNEKDGTIDKAGREVREKSFNEWRDQCIDHFNQHFRVDRWGLAPRGYPTTQAAGKVPFNPEDPLAVTKPPTYTYNRCVQQSFNLRANFFATGASAVRGVRIMIPSQWLEDPRDYDSEAVEQAVRASRLQMDWKDFFRLGRMLGETRIVEVNDAPMREIWAWGEGGNKTRTFNDVKPLVDHIALDDPELGTLWRSVPFLDFMSKAWDREAYPDKTYNEIVTSPMIQHRIWQHGDGDTRKVLYAFANVSNTPAKVEFLYSRGLQGITEATKWGSTTHIYTPRAPGPLSGFAWLGKVETVNMPARSFAAVVVEKG